MENTSTDSVLQNIIPEEEFLENENYVTTVFNNTIDEYTEITQSRSFVSNEISNDEVLFNERTTIDNTQIETENNDT